MLSKNHPLDALLEKLNVEIDDEAQAEVGGFEVREQMSFVNGQYGVHSFQFRDEYIGQKQTTRCSPMDAPLVET